MRGARVVLAAALASMALAATAQDKPCSKADQAAAAKAVDRVVTWPQLQKAWQDYRHCDSGTIDDAFTDALMRMLIEWKAPNLLAEAVDKDPAYGTFVVRHIKSPAAKDDREAVYSRAKSDCPGNLAAFCGKLMEASKP